MMIEDRRSPDSYPAQPELGVIGITPEVVDMSLQLGSRVDGILLNKMDRILRSCTCKCKEHQRDVKRLDNTFLVKWL